MGVAITLAYIVAIKAKGGVIISVSGAFNLVGEGNLKLRQMPLI